MFDGRARMIVGSKFEKNDFSDENIEVEPSLRISVPFGENKTVWGSISNSVRTPSRGEQGGRVVSSILPPGSPELPLPVPAVPVVFGNPNMKSEDVTAFEFGYRTRERLFQFDAAFFYNQFTNLRSLTPGAPICVPSGIIFLIDPTCLASSPYVEIPLLIENNAEYDTYGVELWLSRQISERWRVEGSYTYIAVTNDVSVGGGPELDVVEDSPDHQLSLRSSIDINDSLEFDIMLRWVDELEAQQIDAYTAMDVRLAWTPIPSISVAAVGKNLIAGDHLEFMSELVDLAPVQVESSGFVELRWQFQ